jgi:hypothetical protein
MECSRGNQRRPHIVETVFAAEHHDDIACFDSGSPSRDDIVTLTIDKHNQRFSGQTQIRDGLCPPLRTSPEWLPPADRCPCSPH